MIIIKTILKFAFLKSHLDNIGTNKLNVIQISQYRALYNAVYLLSSQKDMGKMVHFLTTPKHTKSRAVCIILGMHSLYAQLKCNSQMAYIHGMDINATLQMEYKVAAFYTFRWIVILSDSLRSFSYLTYLWYANLQ